ncbi:hypothetical protein [Sandaracinus amylolyticus]|uniref:Uncharacterized protein n=1 Tax=Sandaracinus amylolyticus TaxID=927083 RepID=A0A0F6W021_9BACT|nr:hypothetical protein [Sandaracinus amylolyticus]AKF03802.1 hypothetical protein DB32_000951 [Sandaracinus amylolyticus]
MSRARWAIAGAIALSVPAIAYAWNVSRNVSARDRATRACERIESARAARWTVLEEPARALFEGDVGLVRELFLTMGDTPCAGLRDALASPWAWNAGRTWDDPPMPSERLARIAAAAEGARARCPALMASALSAIPGQDAAAIDAAAASACETMMADFDAYAAAPREASEPTELWQWPERLESLAAALELTP